MTNQDTPIAPQELVMVVGESGQYVFDFSKLLKAGETIAASPAPTVTAAPAGAVSIDESITINSSEIAADLAAGIETAIATGKAIETILTATAARQVMLTCTITSNAGRVRKQRGLLLIEA